ncbi:MAG TPA: ABC transporter permease [Chitinophagaceae bacterium]|nr:ABC transporter permease [Chitinophagaceae bacterium]
MIKNYLLVAIRNLQRNKVFSFINILGLALGICCSLLIILWVQDERSMDNFHANNGRLYMIYENQFYDGKISSGYYTPGVLAAELKKKIPEIEKAINFNVWPDKKAFQVGDKILKEEGNFADPDFFEMFSFPLLEGKPSLALNDPSSIAVSEKMAKHFFGSVAAAMGKTIRCEDKKDFKVSAVYADMPQHSTLKLDFVLNWYAFLDENSWARDWGNNGPATAIMLRADAKPTLVASKIRKFLDGYNKEQDKTFRIELAMQPFNQMYLHSNFKNGQASGGRIEYVKLFSIIAVFILLIACINFMNLTTARSVKRSKEIGIRKVVGALRAILIRQFIGEAVLLTFFATLIAVLLATLMLPAFNDLTGKNIGFPFTNSIFWMQLLVLLIITGVLSGSYPALFLSSFNPATVLKGTMKFSSGATLFRKGLVVFQFVLSIVLIVGTIIVSQQVKYIQHKNLGYDRENLIYIPVEGDLPQQYNVFKQQALGLPGILGVTRMTETPTNLGSSTGGVEWDGKDPAIRPMFTQASVGYDFVKTMKLQLAQGRDFSRDFGTDTSNYLVNEAALRRIGYKDPIGKRLTLWKQTGNIVGVIKDFHFTSLRVPIEPLILRLRDQEGWGTILVKAERGKTKEAVESLGQLCKRLNPKFPFTYYFADEEFNKLYKGEAVIDKLSNFFAFLAIFISCLGLLGLAMFTAEQRTREIGIRKVLGASVSGLFTLLSKEFLQLVIIAFVIATPLAWWAMHNWLKDYEYRTAIHWWIFALAGLLAVIIALATVSFQAVKAALANPVKSLRTE